MISLRTHSTYSIQQAFLDIDALVDRAFSYDYKAIALTDKNSISGIPEFFQSVEKANKKHKKNLLAIAGIDAQVLVEGRWGYITILAMNKDGWKQLIEINYKIVNGFIPIDDLTPFFKSDHLIFMLSGLDNIYLSFKDDPTPILKYLPKCLVNLEAFKESAHSYQALQKSDLCIGFLDRPSVDYIDPDDAQYQRILLCSHYKTTMDEVEGLPIYKEPFVNNAFLKNDNYLRKDPLTPLEEDVLSNCVAYSVGGPPQIPSYSKDDPNDLLMKACRQGWTDRGLSQKIKKGSDLEKIYTQRVKDEFEVFKKYNLSNYLLIIKDFAKFVREQGHSCGLRGSAGGCILSYLIGITDVDPVCPDPMLPHHPDRELMFSRFLNAGRLEGASASLPDIDIDVPIFMREPLIEHIKEVYGSAHVSNIITFARMDGKQAIKEVFRVMKPVNGANKIADEICEYMVDTAKVQDDLEDMKEDNPDYGIIQYCIDNIPRIKEYYDEYKASFDIAIKLSKTIKNTGKHAAGVVLCNQPIVQMFPVIKDPKTGENLLALEMEFAEYVGAVKFDILGVAAYDKIDAIIEMINGKLLEPIIRDIEE